MSQTTSELRSKRKEDTPSGRREHIYLACILLSIVVMLGIMVFNLVRTLHMAQNDVIEMSKNKSEQNAREVELFFLRHGDVLLTTAQALDFNLQQGDFGAEDVVELFRHITDVYSNEIYRKYTSEDFSGVYAAVNGQMLHSKKTPEDLPEGYDPKVRPWYKEGYAGGGKIVFGDPYWDIYSPHMVMSVTKLLDDGDTVVGMDITLDEMQFAGGNMDVSFILNNKEHSYGYGFVLTSSGVVAAHRNKSEQGANYGDPAHTMYPVFRQIQASVEDDTDYFEAEIDGIKYSVFPQKLSNGWYSVTMTGLEDVRNSISQFSIITTIGTVIVTFLALLYAFSITRAYMRSEKLSENLSHALEFAKTDGLTGLSNRYAYDVRVEELRSLIGTDRDISFAIVMMDLNDLKNVNDSCGHTVGDQYILNSCRIVRQILMGEIYRIGGDEFAVFLVDESFDQRSVLVARLKQAVAEANRSVAPSADKPSIAIGMAEHNAGQKDDIDTIIRRADTEMYSDKSAIKQSRLRKP